MTKNEYEGLVVLNDFASFQKDILKYMRKQAVLHPILLSKVEIASIGNNCEFIYGLPDLQLACIHFFYPEQEWHGLQSELHYYETQIKGANAQGLHLLSLWLNETIKTIIAGSPLLLADEFQLEANFKQFDIEVNSTFLKNRLEELRQEKGQLNKDKQLQELNRLLAIQLVILNAILQNLERILSLHLGLKSIYEKISIFQQILSIHLLTREYGILQYMMFEISMELTPILIGNLADKNTRSIIALWLTLKQLIKKIPFAALMKMITNSKEHQEFIIAFAENYRTAFKEESPGIFIS